MILDRYRGLADDLTARVMSARPNAWDNPSPCEGWTALQVMDHVIGNSRAALDRLHNREHVSRPVTDVVAEWSTARNQVEQALLDPTQAAAPVETPFGAMPFETFVGRFMCLDMLVHTWDVARATGGDEQIDAEAAAAALAQLRPLDAQLRSPGLFGPAVEPPPGADVVVELMCFVGRKV
ncbi:MAG: TIGR03086 family metal-binding protein [Sporichthyaceae bacterium]